VFGSPVQPTKFYPNRDICKIKCLLARLCQPGHCPLRTEKSSQPCPVEKLDSSFAGGQGWTRPKLFPAPHAPQGSLTRALTSPTQISLTRLSLWTPVPPEIRRRPWSPPKLVHGSQDPPPPPKIRCRLPRSAAASRDPPPAMVASRAPRSSTTSRPRPRVHGLPWRAPPWPRRLTATPEHLESDRQGLVSERPMASAGAPDGQRLEPDGATTSSARGRLPSSTEAPHGQLRHVQRRSPGSQRSALTGEGGPDCFLKDPIAFLKDLIAFNFVCRTQSRSDFLCKGFCANFGLISYSQLTQPTKQHLTVACLNTPDLPNILQNLNPA
jgi:hypothetical protein